MSLHARMQLEWRVWLQSGLRLVLAGVFIYAGFLKIGAPVQFADSIESFHLLPTFSIHPIALGLPIFEILLGIWVVSGWRKREASFCAVVLSGIFLLALCSAFVRGIPVDCGCFGSGSDPLLGKGHLALAIVRDLVLLGAATFLYHATISQSRSTLPDAARCR